MFRRIDAPAPTALPDSGTKSGRAGATLLTFTFDGSELTARPGETLAAALLAAGQRVFRTNPAMLLPAAGPRAPFCMMGVCFDCLVTIDGLPDCQSCLIPVRAGMQVQSQKGLPR